MPGTHHSYHKHAHYSEAGANPLNAGPMNSLHFKEILTGDHTTKAGLTRKLHNQYLALL